MQATDTATSQSVEGEETQRASQRLLRNCHTGGAKGQVHMGWEWGSWVTSSGETVLRHLQPHCYPTPFYGKVPLASEQPLWRKAADS